MDIIIIKITKYLIPILLLLRKFGFSIFYLRLSEGLKKPNCKWVSVLQERNIVPLPIENLPEISGFSEGYSDPEMKTYKVTQQYVSINLLLAFEKLFSNNKDVIKKLQILVHNTLSYQMLLITQSVNIWGRAHPDRKHLLIDLDFSGFYISGLESNIKLIIIPWELISNGLLRIFNIICSLWDPSQTNMGNNDLDKLKKTQTQQHKKSRIAYVTHKGLRYSTLFKKDLYYSQIENSELFPENLLHFDYTDFSSPSKTIQWVSIGNHRQSWLRNTYNAFVALLHGILYVRCLRHILGVCILTRSYVIFQSFLFQLDQYPELKVFLIDYEILCPKELLMACEARGIKSIATQERFLLAMDNIYGSTILTHYLCDSHYVAEIMKQSPMYNVDKYIPVGQYRSDILIRARHKSPPEILKRPLSQGLKIITALGFHTHLNCYDSQIDPFLNWTAHQHFLDDMVRLANDIPGIFIILRYKFIDWMSLPVFEEIVDRIMSSNNMTISTDYDNFNVSYDLCAHSNLVIAKITSIADECLSVGIPVLLHEYTHNLEGIFSDAYDYSPTRVMCYNYGELLERVRIVLSGTPNEMTQDYEYLKEVVYGGLGDGKVKERVHAFIEGLLREGG